MENNEVKSAVQQFLEGTEPSQDVFSNLENQEGADASEIKEEPKTEKPLAFHKDPKIQRYLEKREREMEERIRSSIPTHEEKNEDQFKEAMDSLTAVIGNDTPEKVNALNALQKALAGIDQRAVQRAEERVMEIQAKEEEGLYEAHEELESSLDAIEESYDVDITSPKSTELRSKFLSYVEKIAPKNKEGEITEYPDMLAAWETFNEIQKATQTPSRSKELANRGLSHSAGTQVRPQERLTWDSVHNMIDNLK